MVQIRGAKRAVRSVECVSEEVGGWFEVRELTSFLVGRLSEMGVRQGRAGLRRG